jgi:hypothetical protein
MGRAVAILGVRLWVGFSHSIDWVGGRSWHIAAAGSRDGNPPGASSLGLGVEHCSSTEGVYRNEASCRDAKAVSIGLKNHL